MADNEKIRVLYNGAAAYDLNIRGNAVEQPRPSRLPEERPRRAPAVRTKPASVFLAVATILALACVMAVLVFAHGRLYDVTSRVSSQKSELAELEKQRALLEGQYNSMIDYRAIEEEATTRLGMSKPTTGQTVYVNLSGADRAEVLSGRGGLLSQVGKLVSDAFAGLGEYLSPAVT